MTALKLPSLFILPAFTLFGQFSKAQVLDAGEMQFTTAPEPWYKPKGQTAFRWHHWLPAFTFKDLTAHGTGVQQLVKE